MSRLLSAAIVLVLAISTQAQPPRYTVQVIGGLEAGGGGTGGPGVVSLPLGLNNNGRTVGYASTSGSQSAIINWRGGAIYSVGIVPGTNRSYGSRVNILGRIAGAAYTTDANGATILSRAIRWRGLIPQDLGTLGGQNAAALGINDSDRIVGYSTLAGESQVRAFQWYNGVISALPIPAGSSLAYAYDISNNNHIVGVHGGPTPVRPLMWYNGLMQPLSIPSWSRTGGASAVNDSGVAVGTYEINQYTGTYAAVAWFWGQRLELGNLGGAYAYATAADINNLDQIVGTSNSPAGYTGYVWMEGEMFDLRDSLVGSSAMQIISAHAINDRGQIAAAAIINGRTTAILLTPVAN